MVQESGNRRGKNGGTGSGRRESSSPARGRSSASRPRREDARQAAGASSRRGRPRPSGRPQPSDAQTGLREPARARGRGGGAAGGRAAGGSPRQASTSKRARRPRPDAPLGYVGSSLGTHRSRFAGLKASPAAKLAAVIALVVLLVFAASGVRGCIAKGDSAADGDGVSSGTPEVVAVSYTPTVGSIASIGASGEEIAPFSLASAEGGYVPALTAAQQARIESVLAEYAPNDRSVGFAIVDLTTGSGYAYNIDEGIYGASTFKGPVSVYACQQVEAGNLSFSAVKENIENAVVWSDNVSYAALRNTIGDSNLQSWLNDMGIESPLAMDTNFPTYSVRESLMLWMSTYLYLDSGDAELTDWLRGLFSSTEVSMIRDAVEGLSFDCDTVKEAAKDAVVCMVGHMQERVVQPLEAVGGNVEVAVGEASPDDGSSAGDDASSEQGTASADEGDGQGDGSQSDVVVYNKAGWIADGSVTATNDAGIVVDGDRAYLISIMTSAPDTEENRELAARLAAALWAARDTLQPQAS